MRALPLSFLATALTVASIPAPAQYMRGVNISGAEFGSNVIPGTYGVNYWYQSPPTFDYFGARGLSFIRLEILWERLQPTPGGPLAPGNPNDNLGFLKNDIAWAKAAGVKVSIDVHNYGRYTVNGTPCIIDNPCNGSSVLVTGADLADFWSKMADEFKDEPTVVAYDIMNEPHDMGVANWNQISQQVVNAIRLKDPNKLIMIPGNQWSNATNWASINGATSWISDPGNNFWYEGHEYFDSPYSGTYNESYDQELAANPDLANIGVTRLTPFVNWCTANNVKCYVGEYGIPNTDSRWLTVLDNFLNALDQAGLPGTYWAAGEWWGSYPLSVQPTNGFTTDAQQLPTLLAHLQPDLLRSTSAAASYGYTVAPGELVAGYGHALAPGPQLGTSPWPTQIGDTQVQVVDANGNTFYAGLLYVSDGQVNYQLPAGMASGLGKISVLNNGVAVSTGIVQVQPIAPGLFTMNNNGQGVAAAYVQAVKPDGSNDGAPQLVATYSMAEGRWVASPISFNGGDNLVLQLLGTGFDAATTNNTQVIVNGNYLNVSSVGPYGAPGEDQITVQLPQSLAGAGTVNVQALIGGTTSNPVTIAFQ